MERAGLVAGVATPPIELRTEPGGEGPAAAPGFLKRFARMMLSTVRAGWCHCRLPSKRKMQKTTEAAEATQPESGVQS